MSGAQLPGQRQAGRNGAFTSAWGASELMSRRCGRNLPRNKHLAEKLLKGITAMQDTRRTEACSI
eukprot:4679617-Pleurochrysis_carterae.AAC.1